MIELTIISQDEQLVRYLFKKDLILRVYSLKMNNGQTTFLVYNEKDSKGENLHFRIHEDFQTTKKIINNQ